MTRAHSDEPQHPSRIRPLFLFLTLATILCLSFVGCSFEDESETDTTETTRTADTSAGADQWDDVSTPTTGWRDADPERLEAERYDESWRQSAALELEARRQRRAEARGTAEDAGDDGRLSEESALEDDSATGTAVRGGSAAPVRDLKRRMGTPAGAPEGEATPDTGPNTGPNTGPAAGSSETAAAGSESWDDLTADGISGPPALPLSGEAAGPTAFRVQWMLDRLRYSPGVIDGRWGKNTEKAVYWLQDELGMETSGEVDRALYDALARGVQGLQPLTRYRVTTGDLSGPFVSVPEEVAEQANLDCMCYESAGEMIAERFHTTPEMIAQLNPEASLDSLAAGDDLWVPNVQVMEEDMAAPDEVDRIVVSKAGFYLHALDAAGNVLYHFPSTLGAGYDPSPDGSMEIATHAYEPKFHYQPKLFSDVPDTDEEQMLPGGPNSPVGMVWLDLSEPHYGIHGTSEPASIGYTTSHGCVRLTNWDAIFLANHVADGTPVEFRQ